MALLASKQHTAGDTRLWTVRYGQWLADNAAIDNVFVRSSSESCVIVESTILGPDVTFLLRGGELNERLTVSLTMNDTVGNVKNDTIAFTVVGT